MADSLELQILSYIKNTGKKIDRTLLLNKIEGLQTTSKDDKAKDAFVRAKTLTQKWLIGFGAEATAETILHSASRLDDDGKITNQDDGGKNLNEGKTNEDLDKLVNYENPSPIDPTGSGIPI